MRILYFSRDYTSHDHRFLTAFSQAGLTTSYLRLERKVHQYEDRPLPPQVKQIPWSGGQSEMRWAQLPRFVSELKGIIRRERPDLILAGPLQRCAFMVALTRFHPLISMSWGYDLIVDAPKNALMRWMTRFTLRRSAHMLGDCNTIRQLAQSYGMPDKRIIIFPWGIDLEHFSPGQRDAPGSQPAFTLLSTRSWEPIYGVDVIARAFTRVARTNPDIQLVMLGNGSQATLLRQTFLKAGLLGAGTNRPRVTFPGQISFDALPHIYRNTDLYLSASHSDGTSISLLEAMACGCPVLISDIPGNREWVEDELNGWLFPKGDSLALAERILLATQKKDKLPAMGKAARLLTEQRANWQANVQLLLNTFRKLSIDSWSLPPEEAEL